MANISINLLPPEITAKELSQVRFNKIQFSGIVIILTLVFLTSLTIALRILQSHNIAQYQVRVVQAEQKVTDLKNTQASLFLLKNRLAAIDQYYGISSKQSSMYELISRLVPASVVISGLSIDKNGSVVLLALAPDFDSLENLISSLTLKENNENKISEVSIDNFNRGKDGSYRIGLSIKSK